MTDQHPITPPSELVEQWYEASVLEGQVTYDEFNFAKLAARWGADAELEACCDTLRRYAHWDLAVCELVADRRPKPPSLKESAIAVLDDWSCTLNAAQKNIIRRALEQLDD